MSEQDEQDENMDQAEPAQGNATPKQEPDQEQHDAEEPDEPRPTPQRRRGPPPR